MPYYYNITLAIHAHVRATYSPSHVRTYFQAFLASPVAEKNAGAHSKEVVLLVFNLLFLYFLTLNGLARSLSDLAKLTKQSGAIPRGNWLLIVCGKFQCTLYNIPPSLSLPLTHSTSLFYFVSHLRNSLYFLLFNSTYTHIHIFTHMDRLSLTLHLQPLPTLPLSL